MGIIKMMKIKISELRRSIKTLLFEATCPTCGAEGAYVGFSDVECTNRECDHYVPSKKQPLGKYKMLNGKEYIPLIRRNTLYDYVINEEELRKIFPKAHQSVIDLYGSADTDANFAIINEFLYKLDQNGRGEDYVSVWYNNDWHDIATFMGDYREDIFLPPQGPGKPFDWDDEDMEDHLWFVYDETSDLPVDSPPVRALHSV